MDQLSEVIARISFSIRPKTSSPIGPEGAITIDAIGYTGSTCQEATAFLEQALGAIGRRQRTRDWYGQGHNRNHNDNSNQQELQS